MPIYEYKCNKCGDCFERIVFNSEDENGLECGSCGSKDVSKLVSSFSRGSSDSGGGIGSTVSSGCSPTGGFS